MVGVAAEFAVGDDLQSDALLHGDGAADRGVLRRAELFGGRRARREFTPDVEQFRRAEQAADVLGAEGRVIHRLSLHVSTSAGR